MIRLDEDTNGFVIFPFPGSNFTVINDEKTFVYLVAFDTTNKSQLSTIYLEMPGSFVSDDVVDRSFFNDVSKDELLRIEYDKIYFPRKLDHEMQSISLVSCTCIGWSEYSYICANGSPWRASYRELTEEGKKLYYCMKKLHNSKEIRILTFNNI